MNAGQAWRGILQTHFRIYEFGYCANIGGSSRRSVYVNSYSEVQVQFQGNVTNNTASVDADLKFSRNVLEFLK